MFCPKCGATNPDGAKFCAGCGAVLGGAGAFAAGTGAAPQVTPVSPKRPKGRVVGIVVGVVAVVAVAALIVYNIFFAERAFRGDIGLIVNGGHGMTSYSLSVSDDTMTITGSGDYGSLTVSAPIASRETVDGGTLFSFEHVTWSNVSGTGDYADTVSDAKESVGNLDASAQILIPNSTSRGGAEGAWSFDARLNMSGGYSNAPRAIDVTARATADESMMSLEASIPNYMVQTFSLTGSNGAYTIMTEEGYSLTLTVLPK